MVVSLLGVRCGSTGGRANDIALIAPDHTVHPDYREPSVAPPELSEYRTIDGRDNHFLYTELGAAGTVLRRFAPNEYGDEISSMAGATRASPREISNAVCAQTAPPGNPLGASDFVWQWGQFLDHDIDLTVSLDPLEPAPIDVPAGDPFFDPAGSGTAQIAFHRSKYHPGTGIDLVYPRQQINQVTHFIDASNVYGSDEVRADALRTNDGTGRLQVSAGNLLPFNATGLENAGGMDPSLFLAGDVRANEQVALTSLHTLFAREHNRLADEIAAGDPALTGEEVYQRARRFVGALMQVITYQEYLPALLGPDGSIPPFGYARETSPAIMNLFSTAAYRYGHSALSATLLRLDAEGNPIPEGNLQLRDAFFAPHRLLNEGGIEPILRGLATQQMSRVDPEVVDDVRNFLFGAPGSGGFDLASLNIQRGRDHGLCGYNAARNVLGLPAKLSFEEMSSNPAVQARLASVYATVDDIDLWVGGLAEDPVSGGHLGELFSKVIIEQFTNLRAGDSHWYDLVLTPAEVVEVEATTLADVIRRNTTIGAEISDDVFHVN
jgi:hypothetical protein